jgi:Ca2+-binding EF-hand superfamily protein
MKKLLIVLSVGLMLVAGSISTSIAGHHYHGCGGMRDMTEMDKNEDGEITLEEFSARQMEKQKNAFDMLDMDNNGVIDSTEYDKFMEVHGYDMSSKS